MHANLAVTEWDIPVRRGVNIDGKITLLGKSQGYFLSLLTWYVPVSEHLCPPQPLAQVQITWVILGCQFNADSVFNLSSWAFRARVNTAGVFVDRSHIKIWRDLAAWRCCIYPISSLWPHPPRLPVPPSWCFCECSLCLFICFALSPCWLGRQFSPCLFFTVVYTNVFLCLQFHCLWHKPKQTHKSLFSPTLSSSDWLLRWCRLTWTGCFYRWLIPPPNLTFVVDVRRLLLCERECLWLTAVWWSQNLNPGITSMTFCTNSTNNLLIFSFCWNPQTAQLISGWILPLLYQEVFKDAEKSYKLQIPLALPLSPCRS